MKTDRQLGCGAAHSHSMLLARACGASSNRQSRTARQSIDVRKCKSAASFPAEHSKWDRYNFSDPTSGAYGTDQRRSMRKAKSLRLIETRTGALRLLICSIKVTSGVDVVL